MKILYISIDNRCRSILAEAITRHVSEGLVQAYSAGTAPDQAIYPAVYGFLRERDVRTVELQTKSVDQLSTSDFDIVVLLSPKLKHQEFEDRFKKSKVLVLPVDDLSHSSASDDELHNYFENVVDTIEFRLRKAIVASESPATETASRQIKRKDLFIDTFCKIEDDEIESAPETH